MSQAPSMPLFVDAFIADTTHLTAEEVGAYMRLLMSMWRHNGTIPDDDKDNARITGTGRNWKRVKGRLSPMLTFENGTITQRRLQKEWKYVQAYKELQRTKGVKSGEARRNKSNDLGRTGAVVRLEPQTNPHSHTHKETTLRKVDVIAEANDPPKNYPVQKAFDNWNIAANAWGLPIAKTLTPDRRKKLRARLVEHGIEGWNEALAIIEGSEFLRGANDRAWRVSLDFMLQPSSLNRLLEGSYSEEVMA